MEQCGGVIIGGLLEVIAATKQNVRCEMTQQRTCVWLMWQSNLVSTCKNTKQKICSIGSNVNNTEYSL